MLLLEFGSSPCARRGVGKRRHAFVVPRRDVVINLVLQVLDGQLDGGFILLKVAGHGRDCCVNLRLSVGVPCKVLDAGRSCTDGQLALDFHSGRAELDVLRVVGQLHEEIPGQQVEVVHSVGRADPVGSDTARKHLRVAEQWGKAPGSLILAIQDAEQQVVVAGNGLHADGRLRHDNITSRAILGHLCIDVVSSIGVIQGGGQIAAYVPELVLRGIVRGRKGAHAQCHVLENHGASSEATRHGQDFRRAVKRHCEIAVNRDGGDLAGYETELQGLIANKHLHRLDGYRRDRAGEVLESILQHIGRFLDVTPPALCVEHGIIDALFTQHRLGLVLVQLCHDGRRYGRVR